MESARIVVIDDHDLFVAGLCSLLKAQSGIEITGLASCRRDALTAVQHRPDLILLDLDLGEESGLDFLSELLEASQGARILVVTALTDPELHLRAVRLGAMGIVLKSDTPEQLLKAIHKVSAGGAWLNSELVSSVVTELHRRVSNRDPETEKIDNLTARELEIMALVGEGYHNKQIGERLFIAEKTVSHYLTSIYSKLDLHSRFELMTYIYTHGLAKAPVCRKPLTKVASAD